MTLRLPTIVLVLAATLSLGLGPARAVSICSSSSGSASSLLGAFNRSAEVSPPNPINAFEQMNAMDAWLEKTNAIGHVFANFDALVSDGTPTTQMENLFAIELPSMWNSRHVPMVTWVPSLPPNYPVQHHDMAKRINGNVYDGYIRNWAILMKQFLAGPDGVYGDLDDRRAFIRFAHEPNIIGQDYGVNDGSGQTAAEYNLMWAHVRGIFDDQFTQPSVDIDRIQWIWSVTWVDVSVSAESVYPGSQYVDWVGIDAYDRPDPADYCDMIDRIRTLAPGKPVGVNEWGLDSFPGTPAPAIKDANIPAFFDWVHANGLKMIVAFNSDINGDWRIFDIARTAAERSRFAGRWPGIGGQGPYGVYPNYKLKTAESWVLGSAPVNVRLITSGAFQGN